MGASVWTEQIPSGKWRVGWRNKAKQAPDGRPLPGRGSVCVADRATARKLEVHVRSTIDLQHYYVHEPVWEVANLSQVLADYLVFLQKDKQLASSTLQVYLSGFKRIRDTIRALEDIPAGAPIPVTVLGVDLCTRLQAAWGHALGARRIYDLSLYLLRAWRWGASQAKRYPGTPPPPADSALVLPLPPKRADNLDARSPGLVRGGDSQGSEG